MAVPRDDGSFSPNLFLSSEQQDLLLTALSSNNPNATSNGAHSQSNSKSSMANAIRSNSNPLSLHLGGSGSFSNNIQGSPLQETPGPDSAARSGFDDSPFLDYDLDDGNFDWDTSADQLFGNLPGEHGSNEDGEHNDKRKNPDDEQDDEEGGGKRREGDDKQARKPGRKPLTSEPTSVCGLQSLHLTRHLISVSLETKGSEPSCPTSFSRAKGETFERTRNEG